MSRVGSDLTKVEKWLKNMKLKGIAKDEEKSMLMVSFSLSEKVFLVQTHVSEDWINIKALVAITTDISQVERGNLYYACLFANFTLHEVTFSADQSGNIWVEADMPIDTIEDNFIVEFRSVVAGIQYFINEIAPKINFAVRSTIYT